MHAGETMHRKPCYNSLLQNHSRKSVGHCVRLSASVSMQK